MSIPLHGILLHQALPGAQRGQLQPRIEVASDLGELKLRCILIRSDAVSVQIAEDWPSTVWQVVLAFPKTLSVEITGTHARDVQTIRCVIEQWSGCNLAHRRWVPRIKLGVLAGGPGAAWTVGSAVETPVSVAVWLWLCVFVVACGAQGLIPCVRRRTIDLRLADAPATDRGGTGAARTIGPEPVPAPKAAADTMRGPG